MKLGLLFSSFLVNLPVAAEPVVNTQFNYYAIYPQRKQDIEQEMSKRSPITFRGQKFKGYTKWYVNWYIYWQEKSDSCQLTRADVTLKVIYTLPKIPDNYAAPREVRNIVNAYLAALFKHEQNHKNSGLYAAQEIEKNLLNLGIFPNCQELKAQANSLGDRIIKKYAQRDIDYDLRTEHGKKEGVMLQNFMP